MRRAIYPKLRLSPPTLCLRLAIAIAHSQSTPEFSIKNVTKIKKSMRNFTKSALSTSSLSYHRQNILETISTLAAFYSYES
jgi:hypothetical protein